MLCNKKSSPKNISKKSAFSLIELSIVLVIIGLLIAGITGGASLIKSAELRGAMGEARGYNVAVNSFFVQFDSLPGDYSVAIGKTSAGDGDSRIEFINDATVTTITGGTTEAKSLAEGVSAWHQLIVSGVVSDDYELVTSTDTYVTTVNLLLAAGTTAAEQVGTLSPGTNIPGSKIKGGGWIFDFADSQPDDQNVIILTGTVETVGNTALNAKYSLYDNSAAALSAILSPSDSLSIDTKLDDGKADSGRIRSVGLTGCSSAAAYTTTETSKKCALSFQVDVTS